MECLKKGDPRRGGILANPEKKTRGTRSGLSTTHSQRTYPLRDSRSGIGGLFFKDRVGDTTFDVEPVALHFGCYVNTCGFPLVLVSLEACLARA